MFKIGLTGGIGSGKTVVSDRLAAAGAAIVDADLIARRVTAPGGAAIAPIAAHFGAAYIAADGSLDRARMRERVFGDAAARAELEAITHPLIRTETASEISRVSAGADAGADAGELPASKTADNATAAAQRAPYLVLAVPLLVESGDWQRRVDRVLVVDCPVETQVARVIQRNALAPAQIRAIIASQASREQRLAAADDVLLNDDKTLEALYEEIDALHRRYLQLAGTASI